MKKQLIELIRELDKYGFSFKVSKKSITIIPPEYLKQVPCYTSHYEDGAYYPIMTWLRNQCNIHLRYY